MRITKTVERWFPVPDDPDKGEVLIRHLKRGELMDISFETTEQETRYRLNDEQNLEPEMTSRSDTRASQIAIFRAAVQDWKNFYDEDGNALTCDGENKIKAMREIDGLVEFVNECREKLAADIEAEKKAQEKN